MQVLRFWVRQQLHQQKIFGGSLNSKDANAFSELYVRPQYDSQDKFFPMQPKNKMLIFGIFSKIFIGFIGTR